MRRNLPDDLQRLRSKGIDVLVCCLDAWERKQLGLEQLEAESLDCGLEFLEYAMPQLAAPPDVDSCAALMSRLKERVDAGKRVAIHCRAGVGRAGTLAACFLLHTGHSRTAGGALALVREHRHPRAVESREQEQFLLRFAEARVHSTD